MIGRSYGSQTIVGSVVKMVREFHSDFGRANNAESTYGLFFSTIKRNMPERFYKTHCSNTTDTGHPIPERRRIADFESRTANRNEDRFTLTRRGGEQLNFPNPKVHNSPFILQSTVRDKTSVTRHKISHSFTHAMKNSTYFY